jgi:hypothetical protein
LLIAVSCDCLIFFTYFKQQTFFLAQGNINMIQAAMKKGVKKFVFVTSLGCGSSKDSIGEQVRTAPYEPQEH